MYKKHRSLYSSIKCSSLYYLPIVGSYAMYVYQTYIYNWMERLKIKNVLCNSILIKLNISILLGNLIKIYVL